MSIGRGATSFFMANSIRRRWVPQHRGRRNIEVLQCNIPYRNLLPGKHFRLDTGLSEDGAKIKGSRLELDIQAATPTQSKRQCIAWPS